MNRDTILEEILAITSNFIIINLATGTGKTKAAIEKAVQWKCKKILVVCPRTALCKVTWPYEFRKWHHEDMLPNVTFCCYKSLYKYSMEIWDAIIFDEAHHLTDNCLAILKETQTKHALFLSATIKKDVRFVLKSFYPTLYDYSIGMRKTIDEGILPDPKVYLIPLDLSETLNSTIEINTTSKTTDSFRYPASKGNYWKCKKSGNKCIMYGTQTKCYKVFDSLWDYYVRNGIDRKRLGGVILQWCASQKNAIVRRILRKLDAERTLTFCCDIKQTLALGPNSINSKSKKESTELLERFNLGEIDHIQACNMLDEGVNLSSCKVGIFANINSSDRLIIQRTGRILRHEEPVIIIPYYKNTREEDLVKKMLENYNPELISVVDTISHLKL